MKERSAAQEHFLDLCHLLGHPTPAEADPTGDSFCFEKGIAKHGGGDANREVLKRIKETGEIFWAISDRDWVQDGANVHASMVGFDCGEEVIYPLRKDHREARQVKYWWLFARTCPDMRKALAGLPRFAATPRVSKHRLVVWLTPEVLCDSAAVVFARADGFFFGILHSRIHEVWSLAQGTQLREKESGFRYTPTTCFEAFPFPEPTEALRQAIGKAAKELNDLRENWLNPPEWTRMETLEFPGTVGGPWDRFIERATIEDRRDFKIGTVRYPRIVARDADCAARLKDRSLTKLYNARPTWLDLAHRTLDAAAAAAYGWPADLPDDAILERLLALNLAQRPTSNA